MITALFRAFIQLFGRRLRGVVLISLFLTLVFFALVFAGLYFLLTNTALVENNWVEAGIDALGGLLVLVMAWFLFPAVCIAVTGFLLEDVAKAVEAKYYPDNPPAREQPLAEQMAVTAKFLLLVMAVNIPVLFLLLVPPVYPFLPFVFLLLNGYLAGREYFELVAHRRADTKTTRIMRKKISLRVFLAGIGIAFLMTIPVVNLVVPVFATAVMLHLFEKWRARGLLPEVAT